VLDTLDALAEPAPAPKKARTSATKKATAVGFCSLSKKDFGDKIKAALVLEKYNQQVTLITLDMDVAFFRSFFGAGITGIKITPEIYDENTPIVVAELTYHAAGEVFGVSKVKGGNRMATIHLAQMCVTLWPQEKRAKAWLTV